MTEIEVYAVTVSSGLSDKRILDLAIKDLRQITRDRKSFLFLLIMPIAFTLLFGFAFGGNSTADPRLPIGLANEDGSELSRQLVAMLATSEVVRIEDQECPRVTLLLNSAVGHNRLAALLQWNRQVEVVNIR